MFTAVLISRCYALSGGGDVASDPTMLMLELGDSCREELNGGRTEAGAQKVNLKDALLPLRLLLSLAPLLKNCVANSSFIVISLKVCIFLLLLSLF